MLQASEKKVLKKKSRYSAVSVTKMGQENFVFWSGFDRGLCLASRKGHDLNRSNTEKTVAECGPMDECTEIGVPMEPKD